MEPLLLTPGPLTTSKITRQAMQRDYGSRDNAFVAMTNRVRQRLVELVANPEEYAAVLMQGSGTFAVEATLTSFIPQDKKVLVLINGAYGKRIRTICQMSQRTVVSLETAEHLPPDLEALDNALAKDKAISHVAAVFCETTTGLLNPIQSIAEIVARHGRHLLIDAMSAFGALALHADKVPFEAVMASSNKCLEGVPGVGFVIARIDSLLAAKGRAASLSLDLADQYQRFQKDGQWRFTPPTHVIAALDQALSLHRDEGGVPARGARYQDNCTTLVQGMAQMGFEPLLPSELQAPIIVTFHQPADPAYEFSTFYQALEERGFAIYPGKLTELPTFRVGCIGHVFGDDIRRFLSVVKEVMAEMKIASGKPT